MKKLVCLFVTIMCLGLVFQTVIAEEAVDLDGMSVEGLLTLKKEITNKLFERDGLVILPNGEYVVGRDIESGSYLITFFENEKSSGSVKISVYKSADARVQYDSANSAYQSYKLEWIIQQEAAFGADPTYQVVELQPFDDALYFASKYDNYIHSGESVRITLEDGQMLYVEYGSNELFAVIEKVPALFAE